MVDTAKALKEVSDFFGAMQLTHHFFLASVLRHGKFVKAQEDKRLKVLEIPQLSDAQWSCRYFAVNLYKWRYSCLIEVLDKITESGNGDEAAEAEGIQAFFIKTRRSNEYFEKCIWNSAKEIAEHANIATAPPSRRTRLPTRYQDCHVLECTGGRVDDCMSSVSQTYRVIYFSVIDKIVIELVHRFEESIPLLQSIAALSPKSPSFLEIALVEPLAKQYDINTINLFNQLDT